MDPLNFTSSSSSQSPSSVDELYADDPNGTTSIHDEMPDCDIMRTYIEYLSDPFRKEPHIRTLITALYCTVACMGAMGNSMVIAAVMRNAQMRTPRNYFIINLALSDLLMCIFVVPFTMYYVLNQFWALGSTACKIVASAQGVNIFVSTMSITAIGLDRYWVILFPTKTQQQRLVIAICFTVIWIFSLALAFPLFYATNTTLPDEMQMPAAKCDLILYVCNENWEGMVFDRRAYALSSTIFQYVLPLTVLTCAYTRIIWRLENRMVHRQRASHASAAAISMMATNTTTNNNNINNNNTVHQHSNSIANNQQFERTISAASTLHSNRRSIEQRQRRTNLLLICVVALFAICWLPLNVYNSLLSFDLVDYNVVGFVACHCFGMTSACANPILYGVFNENFRTEFISILTFLKVIPFLRYVVLKLTPYNFLQRRRQSSSRRSSSRRRSDQSTNTIRGGAAGRTTTVTTLDLQDAVVPPTQAPMRAESVKSKSNSVRFIVFRNPIRNNSVNHHQNQQFRIPRVARFKKFKDTSQNLEFVTTTSTNAAATTTTASVATNLNNEDVRGDEREIQISRSSPASLNGCCVLKNLNSDLIKTNLNISSTSPPKTGQKNILDNIKALIDDDCEDEEDFLVEDQPQPCYQTDHVISTMMNNKVDYSSSSPIDMNEKHSSMIDGGAALSPEDAMIEEKIPLFSGSMKPGGGNLKSYMLNTDL